MPAIPGSMKIYCNPGSDWAACWAQKWNCSPDEIEGIFGGIPGSLSNGAQFRLVSRGMRQFERSGRKSAEYCEKCGHKIMMYEKTSGLSSDTGLPTKATTSER